MMMCTVVGVRMLTHFNKFIVIVIVVFVFLSTPSTIILSEVVMYFLASLTSLKHLIESIIGSYLLS